MSDQNLQPDVTGSTDHAQHRASGQGADGPLAKDAGAPQHSVFDGRGNETVVVTKDDAEGRMSQGTGGSAAEAAADAEKPGNLLGEGYGPPDAREG